MKQYSNPLYSLNFGGGVTLKALSAAVLAGAAGVFAPAFADITSEIDLTQKPINTPTLDYLKDNNVEISQKGEWNATDKTWSSAAPIQSPGSAYTITEGIPYDNAFQYSTADKDGNLTTLTIK